MEEFFCNNKFSRYLALLPIRMLTVGIATLSMLFGIALPVMAALPPLTPGESAANPVTVESELHGAIAVAITGDTIYIGTGNITLTGGVNVSIDNITFKGVGQSLTTLESAAGSRHFTVSGTIIVTFEDLTLQGPVSPVTGGVNGGISTGSTGTATVVMNRCTLTGNENYSSTNGSGGGMIANTAFLTDCTVTNNTSASSGGGIFAINLNMEGCDVSHNTADGNGGGVWAVDVTLVDCTVTDNDATGLLPPSGGALSTGWGGGIYARDAAALTGCVVSDNVALTGGGAMWAGIAVMTDCIVADNMASASGGVGTNSATLTNCTFSDNEATTGNGGGFSADSPSITSQLTNCRLTGNKAGNSGGAIWVGGGTVTLVKCTVSSNEAIGGNGGGVYGNATLTDCTVTGNKALAPLTPPISFGIGGGIYGETHTLNGCTLADNEARDGGGIRGNSVALTNCTLFNNSSFNSGGGINAANAALTNCTVTLNTATNDGGGIFALTSADMKGSIVSGNMAPAGADVYEAALSWPDAPPGPTNDYNIIGQPANYTLTDLFGTVTPVLASNGGPTQTIALPAASTARAVIPASESWLPPTDQRGRIRPTGGALADVGAFEAMEGAGTQTNPYIITTPEELDDVRTNLLAYYMLGNDIDLTAYLAPGGGGYAQWGAAGWMPIGQEPVSSALNAFRGGLDGAGYAVSGLWIDRQTGPDSECVGLFGHAVNATFENLGVVLAPAGIIGDFRVGGLVGRLAAYNGGSASVKNCYVVGDVTGNDSRVGGLLGGFSIGAATGTNPPCDGIVENCYTAGTVTGGNEQIGGLIGYRYTGGISIVRNCYSTCDVTGGNYVGGLIGDQQTGSGTYAGGPHPSTAACYITNCYATGDVVNTSNRIAGGLLGRQDRYDNGSRAEIAGCFTTGNIIGDATNAGGIVGVISETNGTGIIALTENYRYTFASVNLNITPSTSYGAGLRDGDSDATARDFMTELTYSTTTYLTSAWPFGAGGAWDWDDDEKYPMLNLTGETYPFPFYMISYQLDGGVMPSPLSDIHYSYDPKNALSLSTPYTLPIPAKTGYSFSGWYDNAGLTGTPVAVITASDSGHKTFYAKWSLAPTITGPTSMSVGEGYAATATGTYSTTGSPAPTVVKTSGDAAITWNSATMQLDVAAGLAVGTYPVVLTASNGISPDATITFTLTVLQNIFSVIYHANEGIGTLVDPNSPYQTGSTVTVLDTGEIIFPHYLFVCWNTAPDGSGDSYDPGDVFTITTDVALYAQWKGITYIDPGIQRLITVAPSLYGRVIADRQFAKSYETVTLTLLPDDGYVPESIIVHHTNYEGITVPVRGNGDVRTFAMPPYQVTVRSLFTLYNMTDIGEVAQPKSLRAAVVNGVLYVSGLTAGEPWHVYNMLGAVVYQGIAVDETEKIPLPSRGIYIVSDGKRVVKIVN